MKSIWQAESILTEFSTLKSNIKTDVLIIGGGITGILTAHFLHQKGIPYILVEKNSICSGTTQNTTAKITLQHGLIYDKLIQKYNVETAQKYFLGNRIAFEKYTELCNIFDCDYEIKDNFVYSVSDRKKLEDEMKALSNIGCRAKLYDNIPLPIKIEGAVCVPKQAQFNPLKFLWAIAQELNIYENTFVREIDGTTAKTDSAVIKAKKIIVATHFPFINTHGSYFMKLYQHRSYVIALENTADIGGMYVDESDTGLSFRNYKNFLLLGGGGHRTGKKGGSYNELRAFARKNYSDNKEKYHWATQDCMSLDSIPYIGHYSANTPNIYTASGFNKWGMTGAMLAAMILSDMINCKKNDYADIFSPSRSILKPQLFINGIESVKNLLSVSSKRCPHLGCALKWNSQEHTWDCPCHGSRFSKKGKLLDNPANKDLK